MIYDAVLDLYGRGEPADAVTVAAELSRAGTISRVGGHPYLHTLIEDLLEGTLDEMDRMTANGGLGSGVKTGFEQLDEITHGLHPGQMIVVAGRPGSGKSTLAMDFARSAAIKQRQATVIFSLEMSKQDIMMRLFSAEARVKLNDIRSGHLGSRRAGRHGCAEPASV